MYMLLIMLLGSIIGIHVVGYAEEAQNTLPEKQPVVYTPLELIDNFCGDTWCEGEYDYVFDELYQVTPTTWDLKYRTLMYVGEKEIYFFHAVCVLENITPATWTDENFGDPPRTAINQIGDCMEHAEKDINWETDPYVYKYNE